MQHDDLCRQQHWDGGDCFDCRLIAKIRADEREAVKAEYVPVLMEHLRILADLRAKVETHHDRVEASYRAEGDHYYEGSMDAYGVVCDLIDGSE